MSPMRIATNKELETEKMTDTTTIEISVENAEKIHRTQELLQKILRKRKVSADQVIGIFYAVQPLNVILEDMMLEDGIEHVK